MSFLELRNIKKHYATQKAVDDISCVINQGSIFGLLGPNGAGKTTLLRIITGIFFQDSGEVLFDGRAFEPAKDVSLIGYMPEEKGLYKKMKVGEQALYRPVERIDSSAGHRKGQVLVRQAGDGHVVE